MGSSQRVLIFGTVSIVSLLLTCETKKTITFSCGKGIYRQVWNERVSYKTQSVSFSDTRKTCHQKVKLAEKLSYTSSKYCDKIQLEISTYSTASCGYDVGLYIGDPSQNKAVTTLNCENKKWIGQWPSKQLDLQISGTTRNTNNDIFTTVVFTTCKNCYKTATFFGYKSYILTDDGSQDICLDDSYTEYGSPLGLYTGFCGTVSFTVKEEVLVCFIVNFPYKAVSHGVCQTTVSINKKQVLEFENNIWTEWCIPWPLKGKVLTLSFQNWAFLGCFCDVLIKTNSTKKTSSCRPFSDRFDNDVIDYLPCDDVVTTGRSHTSNVDDGDYPIIIAIITAAVVAFMCFCVFMAHLRKTRDERSETPGNINQQQETCLMTPTADDVEHTVDPNASMTCKTHVFPTDMKLQTSLMKDYVPNTNQSTTSLRAASHQTDNIPKPPAYNEIFD